MKRNLLSIFFIFCYSTLHAIDNIAVSINFAKPLSEELKKSYYTRGVESIVYAGDLKYYFYATDEFFTKLADDSLVVHYEKMNPLDKIQKKSLEDIKKSTTTELKVLLFKSKQLKNDTLSNELSKAHATIQKRDKESPFVIIKIESSHINNLLALPFIQYVEINSKKLEVKSDNLMYSIRAAKVSSVNILWDFPYNLSGKGIDVAVVDEGRIMPTHQEFNENGICRIHTLINSGTIQAHSTHVAGIIGSYGINLDAHGMANGVNMYSYYFYDYAFEKAMLKAYEDANILLSNHSYGYFYNVHLGTYNTDAMAIDEAVYNNPYLNAFIAAGNDRDKYGYNEYGITKGPVNSKNILTIGAIDDEGISLASFSSTGPVLDGRIKPDLVANGTMLYSTGIKSDDDYFFLDGTSMASPVATGIAALMMEQYNKITHKNIRHDLLKAILINSAIDKGREGPDYQYGYGLIDAKKAIDLIITLQDDNNYIKNDIVENQQEIEYCIDNTKEGSLKTTLVWIDPAGNPIKQDKTLVNDIDMVLKDSLNHIVYPYTLDKNNPSMTATQDKANKVDNIEQITFESSSKSGILLYLKGSQIITDNQQYSLVSNKPFIPYAHAPTDFKVTTINNYQTHLTWQNDSNNSKEISLYRDGVFLRTVSSNTNEIVDTCLSPNTTHTYQLVVEDICHRKVSSNSISITTPNKVNAPSHLNTQTLSQHTILLQWEDNSCNEKGFYLYKDDKLLKTLPKDQTSYLDNSVDGTQKHTYKVTAFNDEDTSCPTEIESQVFEGDTFQSSNKNYSFTIEKNQPIKITFKSQQNCSDNNFYIILQSEENEECYYFKNISTKDDQENRYTVSYIELDMLSKGRYKILIHATETEDYDISTNILFNKKSLENFAKIIFNKIKQ